MTSDNAEGVQPDNLTVDDVPEQLKNQIIYWQSATKEEVETRSTFAQQLAVLSAGSIALVASGAVAILSYRSSHPGAFIHLPTIAVLIAGVALWAALASCVTHNFLETVIRHRSCEATIKDVVNNIADVTVKFRRDRKSIDSPELKLVIERNKAAVRDSAIKTLRLASLQRRVNAIAVGMFLLGYAALVYLIWAEVKLM